MNMHRLRTTSMGLDPAQVVYCEMAPSLSVSYAITLTIPFPLSSYIGTVTRRSWLHTCSPDWAFTTVSFKNSNKLMPSTAQKLTSNDDKVWFAHLPSMLSRDRKFEGKNRSVVVLRWFSGDFPLQFEQCHLKNFSWYERISLLGRNRKNRYVHSSVVFWVDNICLLSGDFMKQRFTLFTPVWMCRSWTVSIGSWILVSFWFGLLIFIIITQMFSACKEV